MDGAIHKAAGPGLLAELIARYPHGCNTGDALLTRGHDLPAHCKPACFVVEGRLQT